MRLALRDQGATASERNRRAARSMASAENQKLPTPRKDHDRVKPRDAKPRHKNAVAPRAIGSISDRGSNVRIPDERFAQTDPHLGTERAA
jgi:hypothetical protein